MSARLLRVGREPSEAKPAVPEEPCAMASLVEAGRDGRLGDREDASLARHIASCGPCRALARDLDEVRTLLQRPPGASITQLEHQRGRLALLRAASSPQPKVVPAQPASGARPRAPSTWPRIGVALAALAALAMVVLAWRRPAPVPVAQHLPAIHYRLAALAAVSAPRRETTIVGSASARFERRTVAQVERVALSEGTLDLAVRKLGPGERFLVDTDDAEVEVRGTVFQVEAHAGHVTHVAVSEGKVEVRYGQTVTLIAAGGEWWAPVTMGPQAAPSPGPGSGPETGPARPPARVAELSAPSGHDASSKASRHAPVERPATDQGGSSRSFARAVDLLGRGDYAAAGAELQAFRAAYPGDGRGDLAAFLTIVSLHRAGRRGEAQAAARRYLELYPEGDRRAEVLRVANER